MDQPNSRIKFPDRKISETFLEFADPLLAPLGPRATIAQMEQALKIAFTVWNGVVYDKVNGNTQYLDAMRNETRHNRDVAALVDRLIARKRKLFGDDDRLVGEFKFVRRGGQLHLRAEARDPTTRIRSTSRRSPADGARPGDSPRTDCRFVDGYLDSAKLNNVSVITKS